MSTRIMTPSVNNTIVLVHQGDNFTIRLPDGTDIEVSFSGGILRLESETIYNPSKKVPGEKRWITRTSQAAYFHTKD